MSMRFFGDVVTSVFDRSPHALERRADLIARLTARLDRTRGLGYGWDTPAEEARAIFRLLPERDAVLFDLGAHHGEWSATVLRDWPGTVRAVHAFEPSQENCAWMKQFLIAQAPDALRSLLIWPFAVSSNAGHATLYGDRPGSGLASLVHRDLEHMALAHEPTSEVETITLDDHAERHGIDRIDFMKMDIEGHELDALKGAERLLKNGMIRALSFEFGGCNIDSRTFFRDFWKLLTPLGFSFYRILPGAELLPIRKYNEHLERFATTNYVAAIQ